MKKKIYQIPESYVEDLYEDESLLQASNGDEGGTHPIDLGDPDEPIYE